MRDSVTLNSHSLVKEYKGNTMQKVKKEWVCIITTSKANSPEDFFFKYSYAEVSENKESSYKE